MDDASDAPPFESPPPAAHDVQVQLLTAINQLGQLLIAVQPFLAAVSAASSAAVASPVQTNAPTVATAGQSPSPNAPPLKSPLPLMATADSLTPGFPALATSSSPPAPLTYPPPPASCMLRNS